ARNRTQSRLEPRQITHPQGRRQGLITGRRQNHASGVILGDQAMRATLEWRAEAEAGRGRRRYLSPPGSGGACPASGVDQWARRLRAPDGLGEVRDIEEEIGLPA